MIKGTPIPVELKVGYDQFQIFGIVSWIESNEYAPLVTVSTKYPGVQLPPQCMGKELETINMASISIAKTLWENDRVIFNAKFGGRDFRVVIPYRAMICLRFKGTDAIVPLPWANDRQNEIATGGPCPSTETTSFEKDSVTEENSLPDKGFTNVDEKDTVLPTSNVRHLDFGAKRTTT